MGSLHTFQMPQGDLLGFKGVRNMLGDSTDVTVGIAMRDEKITGDACQFSDVQNDGIFRFFGASGFPGEECDSFRLQSYSKS